MSSHSLENKSIQWEFWSVFDIQCRQTLVHHKGPSLISSRSPVKVEHPLCYTDLKGRMHQSHVKCTVWNIFDLCCITQSFSLFTVCLFDRAPWLFFKTHSAACLCKQPYRLYNQSRGCQGTSRQIIWLLSLRLQLQPWCRDDSLSNKHPCVSVQARRQASSTEELL